jgi:8-oxo-dGTP diphosphatase
VAAIVEALFPTSSKTAMMSSGCAEGLNIMAVGPLVGVGAVVISGNCLALMRRRNVSGNGTWSTPGGYLDYGESPADCASREFHEEVGLKVSGFRFLALTNDVFQEDSKHFITIWMVASVLERQPLTHCSEEVDAAEWFLLMNLPSPLFPPFARLITGDSLPPIGLKGIVAQGTNE